MFIDMDGDGLPDRVKREYGGSNDILVQLNNGPYPDLLITASKRNRRLGFNHVCTVHELQQFRRNTCAIAIPRLYRVFANGQRRARQFGHDDLQLYEWIL